MSTDRLDRKHWIPEIMYEDPSEIGASSSIPFIPVPQEETMPQLLYIFESRETGETEPGPDGEELPVTEMDLHQYADMAILKNKLDVEIYNKVRLALNLEPLDVAAAKGRKITERVRTNLEN